MSIYKIRDTLQTTIENKTKLLGDLEHSLSISTMAESLAIKVTIEFLEINLTELNNILDHVNAVIIEYNERKDNYWD